MDCQDIKLGQVTRCENLRFILQDLVCVCRISMKLFLVASHAYASFIGVWSQLHRSCGYKMNNNIKISNYFREFLHNLGSIKNYNELIKKAFVKYSPRKYKTTIFDDFWFSSSYSMILKKFLIFSYKNVPFIFSSFYSFLKHFQHLLLGSLLVQRLPTGKEPHRS